MMEMEMRPCLDEFEKLLLRMNTPRVMIDNAGCVNATLVMIDSARKDGILLEAVQVLTDLNLLIKKGYVSSDGCWNMDVFHVTNLDGNKLTDDSIINCIQQVTFLIYETRRYGGRLGPAWPGAGPPHRPPGPASITTGELQPGVPPQISKIIPLGNG
ncbi:putative [Protein-PII] uridylyltransferase [Helianthus debilis subsp. tardiflorus]